MKPVFLTIRATSYLLPHRKLLGMKQHDQVFVSGHAARGQTDTTGAIQQRPHRCVYGHRRGGRRRGAAGRHDATLTPAQRRRQHFCSGTAGGLPVNPFHKAETLSFCTRPQTGLPLWVRPPPPPHPTPRAQTTREHARYSQLWFGLGRQRRSLFPRGRGQLAWGLGRVWFHWGWTPDIRHRVRLWRRWRRGRRCGRFRRARR